MSVERINNNLLYLDGKAHAEKVGNNCATTPIGNIFQGETVEEGKLFGGFGTERIKDFSGQEDKKVIEKKAKELREKFEEIKRHQAFIGNCWDGVKNFFGKDTGSEHVENQIKAFEKGFITEEEVIETLQEYQKGQEEVVDVTADIVSGIAAVGIYTAAVVATPFTGGASIAVGAAAATATGAAIKTGIKYADTAAKGKEYDTVGYDLATGAFSGVLAPITGGVGGAVGKSVATKLGVQAISETGKAVAKNGGKSSVQNMLLNPTGYKYAGGSMLKRAAAFGAECAADGAVGGAVDNGFRASLNGEDIIAAGANGFVGGLVMAPAIGGGIKGSGKVAKKVSETLSNTKIKEIKVNDLELKINAIKSTLSEFKTSDGKKQFKNSEIDAIAKAITKKNVINVKKLIKISSDDNGFRFNANEFLQLLKVTNKDNISEIEYLSKIKVDDKFRFNATEISELLTVVKKNTLPALKDLAEIKNGEEYRFNTEEIKSIISKLNELNGYYSTPLKELAELKIDGEYRFNAIDIENLFCCLGWHDIISIIKKLAEIKIDGKYRFNGAEITELIPVARGENNIQYIKDLSAIKEGNEYRLNINEINAILQKMPTEVSPVQLKELAELKIDGKYRFSAVDIEKLCKKLVFNDSLSKIKKLAEIKMDGKYRFNSEDIAYLISYVDESLAKIEDLAKFKVDNEYRFNGADISEIINPCLKYKSLDDLLFLSSIKAGSDYRFRVCDIMRSDGSIPVNKRTELEILAKIKNKNGEPLFHIEDILYILIETKINPQLLERVGKLLSTGKLFRIKSELDLINDKTLNLLEDLGKDFDSPDELFSGFLFYNLRNIKDVNELSDTAKIDIMRKLVDSSFETHSMNDKFKQLYPLFPTNDAEYRAILDNLKKSLDKNANILPAHTINDFNMNIKDLTSVFAALSDEEFSKLHISQSSLKEINSNNIMCNDKRVEGLLNKIITIFPELMLQIGKNADSFENFKSSLRIVQKLSQNPKFTTLNDSDRKILILASLLNNLETKGCYELTNKIKMKNKAFEAVSASKKLGLTKDEERKLYAILSHHNWYNDISLYREIDDALFATALHLRNGNVCEMELLLTDAILASTKSKSSLKEMTQNYANELRKNIEYLKNTQPILPTTQIPSASIIKSTIKEVNADGSTNIKGVYLDKDGLVIIKFNEVEDWESIGFPKGSSSKGIQTTLDNGSKVDTGNIKFIVHGFRGEASLARVDAFSSFDSEAMLSTTYTQRPETNSRFFEPQGVILDVDTDNILGGVAKDAGIASKNTVDSLVGLMYRCHLEYRTYISDCIKNGLGMDDAQYREFIKKYANKSIIEIEDVELREKLVKILAKKLENYGAHSYNEMFVTNPNIRAVFVNRGYNDPLIDNPLGFLSHKEKCSIYPNSYRVNVEERCGFLRKFALERDIPLFVFSE